MNAGDSIELIEILDDETDAFGNRAPDETLPDSGGPRWIGPAAALALIGLIGFGVVSSSSSGEAPTAAPITSTSVTSQTSQPAPTSTLPPEPLVPYYAADPPRGYKVQYAEFVDSQFRPQHDFQLWAKPGAEGTSGSWFSLSSFRGTSTIYAQNAYRLQLDDMTLAITHDPVGQTSAQLSNNRSSSVLITAFGWTDEELIRFAQSLNLDTTGPSFTDPTIIAGYELITTVQPWLTMQGLASEQVYYTTSDNPYGGFGITVAPIEPLLARGGLGMDRQTAVRFLLDHATPFTVDGHQAVAGNWLDQNGYSLATWTASDHIVTVSGQMPVAQLISIARTVHQVPVEEWNGMRLQVTMNNTEANANNASAEPNAPVPISSGTDAAGKAWTIDVSVADYGTARQVNWTLGRSADMTIPTESAQINTYVDNSRTYVLADLPRALAAGDELRVTLAGLDPVIVPFTDIDQTLDRTFAGYAFSETGPYTAEIVGPDGSALASWSPS